MADNLLGLREIYDLINENFPGEKEFTITELYNHVLGKYGDKCKPKKDLGANVSHMVSTGLLIRTQDFTGPGTYSKYKSTHKPYENAASTATAKTRVSKRVSQKRLVEILEKKFGDREFDHDMVRDAIGSKSNVYGRLSKLRKQQIIEKIKIPGRSVFYKLRKVEEETPADEPAGKQDHKPADGQAPPESAKSIVPGRQSRQFTVDAEDPAIISKDMLDFFDIPLTILGDAIYSKIQDMKRTIISLEEREARLSRENESMSKRMAEQFKQIQALNNRVSQLNEEARKPKASDKTVRFADVVRVGTLRNK